uniref:Uncharacterized protein n=1 Tax=Knipowitschia caucasica TaxID=637954 RepID=A0AAV2J438_KNICA
MAEQNIRLSDLPDAITDDDLDVKMASCGPWCALCVASCGPVAVQGQLRTPPACLMCVQSHTITVGHPVLRASCAGSLGERFTQRIHGPVFSSLSFPLLLSCLGSCFPGVHTVWSI